MTAANEEGSAKADAGYSICVIGNSHAAAIERAWTNRAPPVLPGVSMTFFAASANLLPELDLRDGKWIPKTPDLKARLAYSSGGADHVDFGKYDAFVLVGLIFGVNIEKICNGYGIADNLKWGDPGTLLSRGCFAATVRARLESGYALRMADTIKSVCDKPVLVCTTPFLSERILEEPGLRDEKRLRDREFLESIMAESRSAAKRLAVEHDCEILWQDPSTVALPCFTRAQYSDKAVRSRLKGDKEFDADRRHGNEEYGVLMLTAALQKLDVISGSRVLASLVKKASA